MAARLKVSMTSDYGLAEEGHMLARELDHALKIPIVGVLGNHDHESGHALKLESALVRLRTLRRIALPHEAPIRSTVEGEPPEIFPRLGTSRLEEPIGRYPGTAVFHGHAHGGVIEGRTLGGIPVHNVALPLWRRHSPDRPFKVLVLED